MGVELSVMVQPRQEVPQNELPYPTLQVPRPPAPVITPLLTKAILNEEESAPTTSIEQAQNNAKETNEAVFHTLVFND